MYAQPVLSKNSWGGKVQHHWLEDRNRKLYGDYGLKTGFIFTEQITQIIKHWNRLRERSCISIFHCGGRCFLCLSTKTLIWLWKACWITFCPKWAWWDFSPTLILNPRKKNRQVSSIITIISRLHCDLLHFNPGHYSRSFHHFMVINSSLRFKALLFFL